LFKELAVWVDANHDGKVEAGEMQSLSSLGIVQLNLSSTLADTADNGNVVGMVSSYVTSDGQTHEMADVWFSKADTGPAAMMTTSQVAALTTADLAALTSADQLNAIVHGAAGVLSATQIQSLTTQQISLLDTHSIATLTSSEAAALGTAQIAALSADQFAALSTADLAELSPAQLHAVSTADLAALSTGQLDVLRHASMVELDFSDQGTVHALHAHALTPELGDGVHGTSLDWPHTPTDHFELQGTAVDHSTGLHDVAYAAATAHAPASDPASLDFASTVGHVAGPAIDPMHQLVDTSLASSGTLDASGHHATGVTLSDLLTPAHAPLMAHDMHGTLTSGQSPQWDHTLDSTALAHLHALHTALQNDEQHKNLPLI
jgi:hypothetical protein